jgi:catechol 2,3-dioxygenase-like lactoylglutathione lyase family enzyme
MDYQLELVFIPVSDVDRAKKFYLEQAGFGLIVDTPIGLTSAAPGAAQGLHLVVSDILAARAELTERGVAVSEVRHLRDGTWVDGPHPQRSNYESFADFTDPDGNVWVLQEVDRSKVQA